jgi:hypothetical protein
MDDKRIYNVNVIAQDVLLTPERVKQRVPMTPAAQNTVLDGRLTVENILSQGPPLHGCRWAVLNPRSGGRPGLRAAAEEAG